jgi:hypothetical protein
MSLFLAIVIGTFFGFALNRAGATNPDNIINMLRLTDLRLMKSILLAIGISSTVLFAGMSLGLIDPGHISIKSAYIGVIIGGALLGIGFAMTGYCPGTGLSAAATGRKDALFFIVGGLLGAFVFTLSYAFLKENTFLFDTIAGGAVSIAQTGNDKYPSLLSANGSLIAIPLGLAIIAIAFFLPNKIGQDRE